MNEFFKNQLDNGLINNDLSEKPDLNNPADKPKEPSQFKKNLRNGIIGAVIGVAGIAGAVKNTLEDQRNGVGPHPLGQGELKKQPTLKPESPKKQNKDEEEIVVPQIKQIPGNNRKDDKPGVIDDSMKFDI